jgi:hypothetical protein
MTVEERWLRSSLKLKLLGLASLERTIARQRARVAGVKDGDASSLFYRIMASSRRQRNHVAVLRSGDRTATDIEGKVQLATDFFMGLLGSPQPREFDLSLGVLGLPPLDLSGLEARFSEEEVWDAICAMPANRSPGPDGFSAEFYRHCWPIVRVDVMATLQSLWLGRDQGLEMLNDTLITLLPKKDGAVDLRILGRLALSTASRACLPRFSPGVWLLGCTSWWTATRRPSSGVVAYTTTFCWSESPPNFSIGRRFLLCFSRSTSPRSSIASLGLSS